MLLDYKNYSGYKYFPSAWVSFFRDVLRIFMKGSSNLYKILAIAVGRRRIFWLLDLLKGSNFALFQWVQALRAVYYKEYFFPHITPKIFKLSESLKAIYTWNCDVFVLEILMDHKFQLTQEDLNCEPLKLP